MTKCRRSTLLQRPNHRTCCRGETSHSNLNRAIEPQSGGLPDQRDVAMNLGEHFKKKAIDLTTLESHPFPEAANTDAGHP
jgi:hypothetical protein